MGQRDQLAAALDFIREGDTLMVARLDRLARSTADLLGIPGTQYLIALGPRPLCGDPMARLVLPGIPHHVTQRGNRRLPVFFGDDDRRAYLDLIAEGARASGTRCLAWCQMDNHVHLILVPTSSDGLRAMLGEAHWPTPV